MWKGGGLLEMVVGVGGGIIGGGGERMVPSREAAVDIGIREVNILVIVMVIVY